MGQEDSFRVIIVGGSVAGLTLANMLQANNIDYVLLEAYPSIAPQVGASIGLLPHGNRILDQLGVLDKIMALSTPVDTFTFRDHNGNPIAKCNNVKQSFDDRHGFPILFLDRRMVLQILYDNIQIKSKVLTSKRVIKVEVSEADSTAITADGTRYSGDIVVGADGIHSTVRDEMWKLANKFHPGLFDTSEAEDVPCDYYCIFGISSFCPGIEPGDMNSVFRDKASYLIIGGPQGRTYWFRFQKFPTRVQGSNIPRFTEADTKKIIQEACFENILPGVKFSKLVENKIVSSVMPLAEHVYKKWHFHRLTTIGDSCHKFHPIGGHGGNAAIETAATFTNLLVEALKFSSNGHLTVSQVDDVFRRVQELRQKRAIFIMDYSHNQQRTEALDNLARKVMAHYVLPLVDDEDVTFNFSCQIPSSEKLNMLPVQRRQRLIPFNDELLNKPRSRGRYHWLLIALYMAIATTVYYGMWVLPGDWGLESALGDILTTGTAKEDPSFTLVRSYTGIPFVDQYLVFLAVIFMPGLRGWNQNYRMHQLYFLGLITQPIGIWTLESFRKRNALTLLAIPSIWFVLFQSTGIGFYMPLYYLCYTWISDVEPYWWPLQRGVPTHYAKALLPATIIGYFLPTILMFIQWKSAEIGQYAETFWQPSPLFVPILTMVFGASYRWQDKRQPPTRLKSSAKYEPVDVPALRKFYRVMCIIGFVLHWYVIFRIMNHGELSFYAVFVPEFNIRPMPLTNALHNIFLADFWGFFLASYIWCVSAVWDLKRVGRTTAGITKAGLIILAANFLLGPGTAISAVWSWREEVMAGRFIITVYERDRSTEEVKANQLN